MRFPHYILNNHYFNLLELVDEYDNLDTPSLLYLPIPPEES